MSKTFHPDSTHIDTDLVRSAYLHVPFCRHRCGYCNFNLVANRDDLIEQYLQAIEMELAGILQIPRPMDTIYLGGGTPSHLSPDQLGRLVESVRRWLVPASYPEITCEMNPLDCTRDRLQVLRDHGINRISLGGQSFSDSKLRVLERDHSGAQLIESLDVCSQFFDNISLDLIFAAPGESESDWKNDVAQAIQLDAISHLSTYGLTVERGSAFFGRTLRQELTEVDSDTQHEMYCHVIDALTSHDWEHYEVSSFARHGARSRHNETYWLGNPWWAFGPGAASFLPLRSASVCSGPKSHLRCTNHGSTSTYLKQVLSGQSAVQECDQVELEQYLRERFVFGMRRMEGVCLDQLSQEWNGPFREQLEPKLSQYIHDGYFEERGSRVSLTRRGLLISDSLWPDFL
ncbi:MAG: radical SAM family heme chaperone HemW [Planctomycetota bacterium]